MLSFRNVKSDVSLTVVRSRGGLLCGGVQRA